jgi:hypothetical protein
VLKGGSAGGILAAAAIGTAQGHRLNRDITASLVIDPTTVGQSRLDGDQDIRPEDIVFGPVTQASVPAKLQAAEAAGIKAVYLHEKNIRGLSTGHPTGT